MQDCFIPWHLTHPIIEIETSLCDAHNNLCHAASPALGTLMQTAAPKLLMVIIALPPSSPSLPYTSLCLSIPMNLLLPP